MASVDILNRSSIERGTSQLKRSQLNKRSKTNKNRHTANKRIDHSIEFIPCEVCQWLYGEDHARGASETHEVFYGSAYLRNMSIAHGAQVKVCSDHHRQAHANNMMLGDRLKQRYQRLVMDNYNMSVEEFIEIFNQNYLGVIESERTDGT